MSAWGTAKSTENNASIFLNEQNDRAARTDPPRDGDEDGEEFRIITTTSIIINA